MGPETIFDDRKGNREDDNSYSGSKVLRLILEAFHEDPLPKDRDNFKDLVVKIQELEITNNEKTTVSLTNG